MALSTLILVCLVFVLAGFAKGIIGLGLPTIAMGLLALVMPPVEAAAILILPSLVTNVWQMVAGPSLAEVVRRLWPMMLAVCLGTWAGIGFMTGPQARYGTVLLGVCLAIYAVLNLVVVRFAIARSWEPLLGPVSGVLTGAITAATGIFAIPAVPYLQGIGLEKEDLVQALGLSFTVSTVALAVNVGVAGGLNAAMAGTTLAALAAVGAGMWAGQVIRLRLSADTFRRWFFVGLLVLGLYLAIRATL
jgi:uncharacterized protein